MAMNIGKLREAGEFLSLPSNNVTFIFLQMVMLIYVSLWSVYLVINELPPNERSFEAFSRVWQNQK